MSDRKRDLWLAIDAGTTTAAACCLSRPGEYRFFAPGDPSKDTRVGDPEDWLVPSAFLHLGDGQIAVGRAALDRLSDAGYADHVVRNLTLNARYGEDKDAEIRSNGREFSPARVLGETLKALRISAVNTFNRDPQLVPGDTEFSGTVTRAVLTVAACFGPRERSFLIKAARETAGFSDVRLIGTPHAAALGLGLHRSEKPKNVLVIDLGGGSLDLVALRVGTGVSGGLFELGRIGCRKFGGMDFDELIARRAIRTGPIKEYDWDNERRLKYGPIEPGLRDLAEQVKQQLCTATDDPESRSADLNWTETRHGKPFNSTWTLKLLEETHVVLLDYIMQLANRLLRGINREEAQVDSGRDTDRPGISWMKVDEVHLVGGGAWLPALQNRLLEALGGEWNRVKLKVAEEPQRIVAEGAAVFADMLSRGEVLSGLRKTRSSSDIGIRGVEDEESLLSSMKSWVQTEKKERKRVFHKMIPANALIKEGQATEFAIPVIDAGSSGKINLSIYEQFPKPPENDEINEDREYRSSALQAGEKKSQPKRTLSLSMRRLAKIRFRNLPDAGTGEKDEIRLLLKFTANRTLEFTATYRRQSLTSRLFGGDFEHLFDFKSGAGVDKR